MYHIIFALALAFWLYVRLERRDNKLFHPDSRSLCPINGVSCSGDHDASVNLFMKRSRELTEKRRDADEDGRLF